MKIFALFAGFFILLGVILFTISRMTVSELKVGDQAPDFALAGSDGKKHKLSDYRGKQAVVLAWFPKAFTPHCTSQCKSFVEGGERLRQFDIAYFAASVDDAEEIKRFAESISADYPILSDPQGKTARLYGVTDAVKKWSSRWTFIIGKDGKILDIDKDVQAATHADDVAKKLEELGVAKR